MFVECILCKVSLNVTKTKYSTWHMLISKLYIDDVVSRLGWAVGNFAGAVFQILSVNINFAGPFNRQTEATISCNSQMDQHKLEFVEFSETNLIYQITPTMAPD